MTKRTVVLSSATGMLLAMFSSLINVQATETGDVRGDLSELVHAILPGQPESAAIGFEHITVSRVPQSPSDQSALRPYARLLEVSGFSAQLDKVPDAVLSSLAMALFDSDDIAPFEQSDIPFLKKALPAAFSSQTLHSAVVAEMQGVLSIDAADQLTQFYSTSLGKALRSAEIDHSMLENTDRFRLWYETHGIASLTIDRQSALIELEQAMQATQGAVEAMIGMQVALQVSLTPVLPVDQQRSAGDLMREAQFQRPGLTESYYQSSLETLAFVFQKQSIDDLHEYTKILETGAGQSYVMGLNRGLSRGLIFAAQDLGLSVQSLLTGRIGQGV